MAKVAVCGCSFSDYTMVDKVYGEWIAEKLGRDYLHYARGGSSNHRGIYIASRGILSGELGKGDILIFQFTDPHRKMLPSMEPDKVANYDHDPRTPGNVESWDTPYGTAYTSDYKMHSHTWQGPTVVGRANAKAHKALEEAAINTAFETDHLAVQFRLLTSLCKEYRVEVVPLINRYVQYRGPVDWRDPNQEDIQGNIAHRFSDVHRNRSFYEKDFMIQGSPEEPSEHDLGWVTTATGKEYDHSHLSEKGHEVLAEHLTSHIRRHKVLDSI